MRKIRLIAAFISAIMVLSSFSFAAEAKTSTEEQKQYVVSAYVTPWNWSGLPDPTKVNIINYSFASVDTVTHEVVFNNPKDINYLTQILALRQENPDLKVLVAIGGAGADGFSQAAETAEGREIFAQSVLDLINQYDLDGVDIDWESPVNGGWGTITAIPEDKQNCTLLMKAIREKIGEDKLLTFADGATDQFATWVEYEELNKYIDYFNMMSYCFSSGAGRYHDSNLYPSKLAAWGGINGVSTHGGVQMHIRNGIPAEKIIMGIPFCGFNFDAGNAAMKYGQVVSMINSDDYILAWDDDAKANYLLNTSGNVAASIETPAAIFYKGNYIKRSGLGGMMYWEYGQDDSDGTLRTAVWENLNGVEKSVFKINASKAYHNLLGLAECESPFIVENERALLPLRISSMAVGADSCEWDDNTITLTFGSLSVVFTIGSTEILLQSGDGSVIDKGTVSENEVPQIINGRTYLPARALSIATNNSIVYKENSLGGFVLFSANQLSENEIDSAISFAEKKINS